MPLYGTGQGFEAYANMQALGAGTRLKNVEAATGEMHLQQQQQMMQLLSRQGLPPPNPTGQPQPDSADSLIRHVRSLADASFATGNFKQATDAAKTVAQMERDKATQDSQRQRAKYQDFQEQHAELQEIDGLLAGVHDQPSFEAAKMTYMASHPGTQVPPQFAYYNPQMVEAVRTGTKEGLAKLRQEANDEARKAAAASRADAASSRHFRDTLAATREAREEKSAAQRAKNGGAKVPVVGLPNTALMSYTQSLINKDYPKDQKPTVSGFGKDELYTQHAFEVASEAKALMAQNRGLSADQAVARAYEAAKSRGDFASPEVEEKGFSFGNVLKDMFGGSGGKAVPGSSKAMPLPLPPDRKLRKGVWYLVNGKPAQWSGE